MTASARHRVLITGSRSWTDAAVIYAALDEVLARHPVLTVVHGAAAGADWTADRWCGIRWHQGRDVLAERHRADWDRLGKGAGFKRNQEMVNAGADEALAFVMACRSPRCRNRAPHGSHGTMDCAGRARRAGIPVTVHTEDALRGEHLKPVRR